MCKYFHSNKKKTVQGKCIYKMCLLKLYNACCVKFEKKDTDGINKNPCMSTKKKKKFSYQKLLG